MSSNFMPRTRSVRFTLILLVVLVIVSLLTIYFHNRLVTYEYTSEQTARQTLKQVQLAISEDDRVYGSRSAATRLVFYGDASCQYCRQLFFTLRSVVDESNGSVALVYRHIPIRYLRGVVGAEEIASECVQRERGDEGFFAFIQNLYTKIGPQGTVNPVPDKIIFESAEMVGVSKATIDECIQQRYAVAHIESQHIRGELLGVGTIPHTFIVTDTGNLSVTGNRPASFFWATINSIGDVNRAQ
jgi:hypothetical protein